MTDTPAPPNAATALTVTSDDGSLVLVGELDMATVPVLRAALHAAVDAGAGRLVIEMSGVAFMDSSGLRELISFHRDAGAFTLRNPSPSVVRILELTQSGGVFDIEVDS